MLLFHSRHTQNTHVFSATTADSLGPWTPSGTVQSTVICLFLKFSVLHVNKTSNNLQSWWEAAEKRAVQHFVSRYSSVPGLFTWPRSPPFSRAVQRFQPKSRGTQTSAPRLHVLFCVCAITLRRFLIRQKTDKEMAHCLLGFSILWIWWLRFFFFCSFS